MPHPSQTPACAIDALGSSCNSFAQKTQIERTTRAKGNGLIRSTTTGWNFQADLQMLDLVIDLLQQPQRHLTDRLGQVLASALCDYLTVVVKDTELMELSSPVNADKISRIF